MYETKHNFNWHIHDYTQDQLDRWMTHNVLKVIVQGCVNNNIFMPVLPTQICEGSTQHNGRGLQNN